MDVIEPIKDPANICNRLGYARDLAAEAMEAIERNDYLKAIANSAAVRGVMGEVVYSLAVMVATTPQPIARPRNEGN